LKSTAFEEKQVFLFLQFFQSQVVVASFPGRSLTWVSTSEPKSVGAKVPPHKRSRDEATVSPQIVLDDHHFTSEAIGDTTVVKRKCAKPSGPPLNAPLVAKSFSRTIRKCLGCKKPLSTTIEGYNEEDDKEYCFGHFKGYNFWNKSTKRYQVTTSTSIIT